MKVSKSLLLLLGLSASASALAQENYPIDIEMARPALSPDALLSIDSPRNFRKGSYLIGLPIQYERAPLRLWDSGEHVGDVVANRTVLHLGGTVSISKVVSLGLDMPLAMHVASDAEQLTNDGVGLGDLATSVRWTVADFKETVVGLKLRAFWPTGDKTRWMGEEYPRVDIGVLTHTQLGGLEVLFNPHVHLRVPVRTLQDFEASSELRLNAGLRAKLSPTLEIMLEWLNHFNVGSLDAGASVFSEAIAGVRFHQSKRIRLDFTLGRGITEGPGTTGIRVGIGISMLRIAPKPIVKEEVTVVQIENFLDDLEYEDPPDPVEDAPPPPPVSTELAVIELDEITIREPIRFAVNTANILEVSDPVVNAVAKVMNDDVRIAHLVIEGHASQEGEFGYNYALSIRRAASIYESLIRAGVHPERMSIRGMGEVVNAAAESEDEAQMAVDRRVLFHIVRQYKPGEATPTFADTILLPWNGESQDMTIPPGLPVPKAAPTAPVDLFNDKQSVPSMALPTVTEETAVRQQEVQEQAAQDEQAAEQQAEAERAVKADESQAEDAFWGDLEASESEGPDTDRAVKAGAGWVPVSDETNTPKEPAPAEEAQPETTPAEETPAEETPAEETPAAEAPPTKVQMPAPPTKAVIPKSTDPEEAQ